MNGPSDASAMETVSCNACGSENVRVLFHRPYREEILADGESLAATTDQFQGFGRIVRCVGCGLVFTNPRPREALLLKGYGECVDETYLDESSSRSINAHLSLRTIRRFKRSGRLLEVGASTGYFLNAARVDFEVEGLEPSAWASKIARDRFRLDVHPETLETARYEPESFDAVAMVDVIEHLADPKRAIERAARLLKPGGVLYLMTPSITSLSARLLGSYWWGLRPAHIYYFSPETIALLLESAGLEIKLTRSFGRIFTYGYWLSRLKHYPRAVSGAVALAVRALDIEDKLLYLDTRDSMEVCAVKR